MRRRYATATLVVLGLLVAAGTMLGAGPTALAYENPECLTCHSAGGTASVQVQFEVVPVDKQRCWSCHWVQGHGYIANVGTSYGWFSSADSPFASPAVLHTVHARSTPASYGSVCVNCHYAASCSSCHGTDILHTDHTYDASSATYAFPPETIQVSGGTPINDPSGGPGAYMASLTCVNASCHAQLGSGFVVAPRCDSCHETHGGVSHVYEDFSPTCQACHGSTNTLPEIHQTYADAQSVSVCSVCHNPKNIATGKTADCFDCHSSLGPAQSFPTNHPYDPPTHESTTTSCLGVGCHVSQVPSNHTTTTASDTNDCERCHQTGFSTNGLDPKDCTGSGCHPVQPADHAYAISGVPEKHITSWNVSLCLGSGCHDSANLWDEHAPRAPSAGGPFGCTTCHGSADPNVTGAIAAHNAACDACHPTVTPQGHYAQHEATPTISSGAYGTDSCQNCHPNNLINQHVGRIGPGSVPLDCATCHQSSDLAVQAAIASGSTRCDACHTIHGNPIFIHETTTAASGTECGLCHYSNVGSEHSSRGFGCSACHESTSTAVQGAIMLGEKHCGACHPSYHADLDTVHSASTTESVTGCGSCHDHAVSGAIDVRAMHAQVTSPGPCGVCHFNAQRVPDIGAKTAECSSCHTTEGTDYHRAISTAHTYSAMDPGCLAAGCHVANTLPEAHQPYLGRYPQYADTCALCHLNADADRIDWDTATAACDSCHTIHGDLEVLHQAPESQECIDCHETADVRPIHAAVAADPCSVCHNTSITLPSSTKCTNCHDFSPVDPKHYDGSTHTAAAQTGGCENCHYLEMKPEHFKSTSGPVSCVDCHELKVDGITVAGGWDKTCSACHPTKHDRQNAKHASTRTSCQGAKCHVIDDVSSQNAGANMHTSCQRCHGPAKYPTTTDCLSSGCHPAKSVDHAWDPATMTRHETTWALTSCIASGCHTSSNLWNEHEGRTPNAGGSFACRTCHDPAGSTVRAAVLAGRTGCDACHPSASVQGHHEQHNAAGAIDPGCKGCHFEYLDDEHLALGYPCSTCHDSSNTAVRDAIADHKRACRNCHPAVNGRDRHAALDSVEFIAGNASVHRVYDSLPGMRSNFLVNGTTYTMSLPSSASSFLKTGWSYDSMVSCENCHSFGSNPTGPHGASVQVNIDPNYTTKYGSGILSNSGSGMSSGLLCSKCHTLRSSSGSWSNVVHKEHDDRGLTEGGRCVSCHVSVPHGWGRPRLIGSQWDPAPYKTVSGGIYEIALKNYSPSNWQKSDCYAGCSTGRHPNQSDPWPAAPQTAGTLAGRVTNASGQALSGVSITTDKGPAATTDANGYYTLAGIATGAYQVTASNTGFTPQTKSATVYDGRTTTLDFALEPVPTGALAGTVTDASTGAGVSDASVSVGGGPSTTTNSNGSYSITGLAEGTYSVTFSKTGYASQTKSVIIAGGQTTAQNVALVPTGGNLALGKPTAASSYRSGYEPSKATDGNTGTRWYSNGTSNTQWLRVDLGSSTSIAKVVIAWYGSYYAKSYKVEVSSDGSTWSKVYETGDGKSGTKTVTFSATNRRYVRVSCTRANTSSGYSITELEVYPPTSSSSRT